MTPAAGRTVPREVRLIGGRWKRRKLPVADRPGLRPTPDRVRETLFNWLGQDLTGWRCLDAFAGSGALGFEAASRGAVEVVLLERDAALAASLRQVRERLQAGPPVRIECADALKWMAAQPAHRFDLVFLDPPFDAGLFAPALDAAARLLPPGGWAYLEAPEPLPTVAPGATGWRLHRDGRAGAVHFHLLQREG
ncbi:16S rRNA (guanine(966)-N(2))-methyltransferase RsmD [Aquabacterium sp. J223]|uniref:16S rRNA (guanine(966)-N(2))-methyltransferase RsmD n=1 Tax=Aquabacterium sp. J223 TaxID=2898431 RepID=UPI0021ADEE71|nr:16S rRNA (guanine(966)-N(2))-methyltransferase RsmD [Aquabacterium sp. J223]UUX96576.1 16S rRNA (guanine(966)-N(2))-methyltransferase RsmD [Aquabacterium sp. J223]